MVSVVTGGAASDAVKSISASLFPGNRRKPNARQMTQQKIDSPTDIKPLKELEADHTPDGWPAVRMWEITSLCRMIAGAKILRDEPRRLQLSDDGYWWLDGIQVNDLESAFFASGGE